MALVKCAECGGSVSSLAKACPSCGAPPPAPNIWDDDQPLLPAKAAGGRRINLPLGFGIVFLPFIFAWFTLRDGYSGGARLAAFGWLALIMVSVVMNGDPRLAKPESECFSDYAKCADNGELVTNPHWQPRIQAACMTAAERSAKYGKPEWGRFFDGPTFAIYRPGVDYVKTGIVTVTDRNSKFSNGFGAMVRAEVVCVYNINAKNVVSIDVHPLGN